MYIISTGAGTFCSVTVCCSLYLEWPCSIFEICLKITFFRRCSLDPFAFTKKMDLVFFKLFGKKKKKAKIIILFILCLMLSCFVFLFGFFLFPLSLYKERRICRKFDEKKLMEFPCSLDSFCGIYDRKEWSSPFTSYLCWVWRREGHIWRGTVILNLYSSNNTMERFWLKEVKHAWRAKLSAAGRNSYSTEMHDETAIIFICFLFISPFTSCTHVGNQRIIISVMVFLSDRLTRFCILTLGRFQ